ncbi:MAG: chemotaxis protein CheW [Gemmatimonadaceae bacterium]|nr:chemotaxis protein CheW [Gemmatimonadaceae bacterium]
MSAALADARTTTGHQEYVTFRLAGQWLGIPVMVVQEVLVAMQIACVPLAPDAIAGFLNLRGQIVTALDLRTTLRMPPREPGAAIMNVVVRHDGELFAFMVDEVGDVLSVDAADVAPPPPTLDSRWRSACLGIIRQEAGLLLVLNVHDVLRLDPPPP